MINLCCSVIPRQKHNTAREYPAFSICSMMSLLFTGILSAGRTNGRFGVFAPGTDSRWNRFITYERRLPLFDIEALLKLFPPALQVNDANIGVAKQMLAGLSGADEMADVCIALSTRCQELEACGKYGLRILCAFSLERLTLLVLCCLTSDASVPPWGKSVYIDV